MTDLDEMNAGFGEALKIWDDMPRPYDLNIKRIIDFAQRLRAAWQGEPVATMSECCGIIRAGVHPPPVMHTRACRGRNGGELGPTIYLYAAPASDHVCTRCNENVGDGDVDGCRDPDCPEAK